MFYLWWLQERNEESSEEEEPPMAHGQVRREMSEMLNVLLDEGKRRMILVFDMWGLIGCFLQIMKCL